jgi:hypothetical protein
LLAVLVNTTATGAAGIDTVALPVLFVFISVAFLVTSVPATLFVGVTNSCSTALAPLARVPTFHISVAWL